MNPVATSEHTPPARPIMSWTAPSHHNHERSARWYLIGGGLILAICVYAILTGAWTVAFVSLLVGGTYFLTRREETPLKSIRLDKDGVTFQDNFTPWDKCKEFWIVQTPLYNELHIIRDAKANREIRIQTANIDVTILRSALSQFLTMRVDQRERLLDVIIRLCKL